MLRVRSGEGQASKLPAVDEAALAEMRQVIADAQAEISRLVQLGELQNDPLRHPIQALSVHLDALYKVTRAGSQALAKQLQVAAERITPAEPAVRDEELRQAVVEGIAASGMAHKLSARNAAVGAGLLLAAVLAGGRAGYWFGQSTEAARLVQVPPALGVALTGSDAAQWMNLIRLNDIGKAERVCADQAGGVACAITLWVKPPAAIRNEPAK